MAPFWSDNDIRLDGEIFYEVHVAGNNSNSDQILSQVNAFISNQTEDNFTGTWMLVAQWDEVPPWPAGSPFAVYYGYDDIDDVSVWVKELIGTMHKFMFATSVLTEQHLPGHCNH